MLSLSLLAGLVASSSLVSASMEIRRTSQHQAQAARALDSILDMTEESILDARSTHDLEVRSDPVPTAADPCPADKPNWEVRNGPTWWEVDPYQQDHARFHAYLSMSTYGDYKKECASTWPNGGFTVLSEFSAPGKPWGQDGYIAKIPSMQKIVLVFKGNQLAGTDLTPVSIEDLVPDCTGCKAAAGVKQLFLQAQKATNDFAAFTSAVKSSGLLSSVTGHGIGGSVAVLATLHLGPQGRIQYSHNQGMPRTFNYASVYRYNRIVQMEASQSLVNRNDYLINAVPKGNFCHVGQKAHLTGPLDQWWTNCYGFPENKTCLGDFSSQSDHTYYFTPLGKCGSADKGF